VLACVCDVNILGCGLSFLMSSFLFFYFFVCGTWVHLSICCNPVVHVLCKLSIVDTVVENFMNLILFVSSKKC